MMLHCIGGVLLRVRWPGSRTLVRHGGHFCSVLATLEALLHSRWTASAGTIVNTTRSSGWEGFIDFLTGCRLMRPASHPSSPPFGTTLIEVLFQCRIHRQANDGAPFGYRSALSPLSPWQTYADMWQDQELLAKAISAGIRKLTQNMLFAGATSLTNCISTSPSLGPRVRVMPSSFSSRCRIST